MESKIQDGLALITIHKLMGLPETDQLNKEVNSLLGQNIKHIILDMKEIDWIGSMGVGTLIRNLTSVKNKGSSLYIANISEKASHVLKVTHLLKFFDMYDSVEEAVASVKSNQ